jgi:O-antigen/teichoic acid export membrane protein
MRSVAASLFWRRFTVVISGSAMAQIIPFATMPILTRLLPPEVLGPYLVWLGVVALLSIVLSLRLDVAIFNAQTEKDLQTMLQSAVVMVVTLAVILWGIVLGLKTVEPLLTLKLYLNWWSAEAIALSAIWAINMVIQSAYIYGGNFKRQAFFKIILAIAVAFSQLTGVLLGYEIQGIIVLQIILTASILLLNIYDLKKIYKLNYSDFCAPKLLNTLKVYWRFPLFSMPADFVSSMTGQLPIFILGKNFGAEVAGNYALMNKSVIAPSKLIAGSVLSIFKEEASREFRVRGQCKSIYLKTLTRLASLGIVPFGCLYFFSEYIFGFIFGDNWVDAGRIASVLAPMLYLQFIASPLSYTLYLAGKNLNDLLWQLALLIVISAILILSNNIKLTLILISLGYSLMYLINIIMSYSAAKGIK